MGLSKDEHKKITNNIKRRQKKEDTYPIVAWEYVVITSAIDALKKMDFYVVDIPVEFLTADIEDDVTMVLQGRLAKLMLKTKPSIHENVVTIKNGRTVLYINEQKSLYRCLMSALLFHEKMVRT